jgi:hypothetical protein
MAGRRDGAEACDCRQDDTGVKAKKASKDDEVGPSSAPDKGDDDVLI